MEYVQLLSKIIEVNSITPIDICKSINVDTGKGSQFILFHDEVQNMFKRAISNCHGKYSCLHSPLVSEVDVNALVASFKSKFPFQIAAIESLLNTSSKLEYDKLSHLEPHYDLWYYGHSYQL